MKTTHGANQPQSSGTSSDRDNTLNDVVPVRRSREDARKTYNRLSRWYDLMAEGSEKRLRDIGIMLLNPAKGERILEIGYGTGRSVEQLARTVGNTGGIYGIDLSSGMNEVASRRIHRSCLASRVHLSVGDATEQFPYSKHFFDAIFMNFTLELFNTPEFGAVLAECKRVLKPDGRLVIVSMDSRNIGKFSVMSKLYLWGHEQFPRLIDCRPIPAEQILQGYGWMITAATKESMFGLPVIILRAIFEEPVNNVEHK